MLLYWCIGDGRLGGVDSIGDQNRGDVVGDGHHSSRPLY